MPDQPEELEPPSRFRLSDVQTRAVSSCGTLEDLTALLRYLLSRIESQAAEIRRKAALYEARGRSSRQTESTRSKPGLDAGCLPVS